MQRHTFCCLFFFSLQFALFSSTPITDAPGVCRNTVMLTKERHVIDRATMKWKIQKYSEPKLMIECCPGYTSDADAGPLQCVPVCEPKCVNAVCEEPDTCVCFAGHTITNISNNTCFEICDSCINGACHEFESECTCFEGYRADERFKHICNPVCSHPCVNSTCAGPETCECLDKFVKDPINKYACTPKCTNACVFGKCTDPDECSCFDGYINDEQSPHVCVPICKQICENGFCDRPNSCKCFDGYQPHPRNPYKCVPQIPQDYTFSSCELRLPKAIKYSTSSNCYIMKEDSFIKNDSQCGSLGAFLQPMCREDNSCSISQCVLNFRCSAMIGNMTNEIHCDLAMDDFRTEESTNITINDEDDWLDVVLLLNSVQHINLSSESLIINQTHDWTVHRVSKWAVCGQKDFALEVCGSPTVISSPSHGFGVLGYFIVVVLLLSCSAGGAWFYWTNYRTRNDPLNYRENMLRGFNNRGYEDPPSELLARDAEEENMVL